MKSIARLFAVLLCFLVPTLARAAWWTNGSVTSTAALLVSTGSPISFTSANVNGVPTGVTINQTLSVAFVNISNPNATLGYLQFFDSATTGAVTVGTTVPTFWIAVQGSVASGGGGVQSIPLPLNCTWVFTKGIVVAWTTTPTGSTAPGSAAAVALKTL